MTSDMLDLAKTVLAAQPFSRLLGTEVLSMGRGEASLALAIGPSLRQQDGFVHGGVLAYLVDNAITFVGGSVLGAGVVTVEMKLNYLRPAVGDGRLVAAASLLGAGRTQAVCRCDVWLDRADGTRALVAAGQGTIRVGSARPTREAEAA